MSRRRRNVMRRSSAEREQLAYVDRETERVLGANVESYGQTPADWAETWRDAQTGGWL